MRAKRLKLTFGVGRKRRAYAVEKPMCVMGKVGRKSLQRGRYFNCHGVEQGS